MTLDRENTSKADSREATSRSWQGDGHMPSSKTQVPVMIQKISALVPVPQVYSKIHSSKFRCSILQDCTHFDSEADKQFR